MSGREDACVIPSDVHQAVELAAWAKRGNEQFAVLGSGGTRLDEPVSFNAIGPIAFACRSGPSTVN